MSTQWDVVILGCGQLGRNLKTQLEIENCNVLGVRRTPMPEMPNMVACDLDQPETWEWLSQQPLSEHAVVVGIVTPDARTEAAYRARYVPVAKRMVEWARLPGRSHRLVWVSSTAVFGTHQHGVLDEHTPPEPDHWRGEVILEAETHIAQSKVVHSILRCSGLYTADTLLRLKDSSVRSNLNPDTVSNRFHREDAVQWLAALVTAHMKHHPMPALVQGVDQCPLQYRDIFRFLDGEQATLRAATTGRRLDSRFRDQMPALRYPSIDAFQTR